MTIKELESFASNLALEWDLTECEADDLLATGVTLCMGCRCERETVRLHMEIRAEVLALVGSECEEMYQAMKDHYRGRRD